MLKVGITGGIGSGKSTVCRIFKTLGIPVFDADEEAKRILLSDKQVMAEVKRILGEEVFVNGIPNRKKIAAVVFNDQKKLQQLNSILHPATFRAYEGWQQKKINAPYSLMEAALIFETGGEKFLDTVIVVTAPEELRVKRAIQRNQQSETEVRARMKNQFHQNDLEQRANFLIVNDEQRLLVTQVMTVHEALLQLIPR